MFVRFIWPKHFNSPRVRRAFHQLQILLLPRDIGRSPRNVSENVLARLVQCLTVSHRPERILRRTLTLRHPERECTVDYLWLTIFIARLFSAKLVRPDSVELILRSCECANVLLQLEMAAATWFVFILCDESIKVCYLCILQRQYACCSSKAGPLTAQFFVTRSAVRARR